MQVGLWEHGKLRVYAPPGVLWQTRPIVEHTPVAVAAASTYIVTLSVFCDRGQPVLAMLLHRPPPSVPLTFTMVFHMGWVNVSMGRRHSAGTLWRRTWWVSIAAGVIQPGRRCLPPSRWRHAGRGLAERRGRSIAVRDEKLQLTNYIDTRAAAKRT